MKRSTRWLTGAITAAAVLATACGDSVSDKQTISTTPAPSAAAAAATAAPTDAAAAVNTAATSMTKAADLRTTLNGLLSEHVALAASATAGALGGRQAQFDGAAAALDANSVELSKAVGSVYGAPAEQAFLPLWRKHIGFIVDYTQGAAAKDQAKQEKAVADLTQYTQDFGAFLNAANGLPKDTVAKLLVEHVLGLKAVVDAQAVGDQPRVYSTLRTAMAHMQMVADPLAEATVKKFPDKFTS